MSDAYLRILVVDDERAIRRFLRASLETHQFIVEETATGSEALQAVISFRPDLLILDLNLPDMDGIEITRRIREWSQVPIIILSVRERETDKIAALDAGADDYLTKPFSVGELMARIRVAIRHVQRDTEEPVLNFDQLRVDLGRRSVTIAGHDAGLTPTEYDLLRLLVIKAGKVMTHHQLLREVWGTGYETENHLLRVNISNLRRKIEPDLSQPQYILTEPGVGYRFRSGDEQGE